MAGPSVDLFNNLKIDQWFKAVTYIGGVIFVLAIFLPVQVGSNQLVAVLGAGLFILGVGRWKNQKAFAGVQGGFKISGEKRIPDLAGLLIELVGWVLLVYVAWTAVTGFLNGANLPV
jgi:hypothetical protein